MNINVSAWNLRSDIFHLVVKASDLASRSLQNEATALDKRFEAYQQLLLIKSSLLEVYDNLPEICIDATRDAKDQEFNFS